jgi:hypothetical protein
MDFVQQANAYSLFDITGDDDDNNIVVGYDGDVGDDVGDGVVDRRGDGRGDGENDDDRHHETCQRRIMDEDLQFDIRYYRGEGMEKYLIERRQKLDGICEELLRSSLSTQKKGFFSLCRTLNSRDADTLERAIQSKEAMLSWEKALQGREGCPHLVELLQNRPMQKLSVIVEEEETDDKTEVDDGDTADVDAAVEWPSSPACEEGDTIRFNVSSPPHTSKRMSQHNVKNVLEDLGSVWMSGRRRSARFQGGKGSIIVNGLRRSARLM